MPYESRIPMIVAELAAKAELTVSEAADRVVDAARERVPRLTGRLHDAIHKAPADDGEGFYVLAGDRETFYGHIVEHGGVNTAPRPFMVPAAEEVRNEVQAIGRRNLGGL